MMSSQAKVLKEKLFANKDLDYLLNTDIYMQRKDWEESVLDMEIPEGIMVENIDIDNINGEFINLQNNETDYVILYFHGGGLCLGSSITHRNLAANIAKFTCLPVFVHNYPLAPEHPYPAALENSQNVYLWLIQKGYKEKRIIFGGDSSGCALALSLIFKLKEKHYDLPGAVFLFSPMLDFTLSGDSLKSNSEIDPCLFEEDMRMSVEHYCRNEDCTNPFITPLNGCFHNFPPILIQVGSSEMLFDDAVRLHVKAQTCNVETHLQIWDELWHVFQSNIGIIPEAAQALIKVNLFIKEIME